MAFNLQQLNLWLLSLQLPIRYATLGDSTATFETAQGQDITIINSSGSTFQNIRFPSHLSMFSGGLFLPVACCGVSGDTTTGVIARDVTAYSSTRRAATDAGAIGAKVVFVLIGVNDLRNGINASTTSGVATALVTTTLANIMTIMGRCYSLGMWPMYMSIAGQTYGSAAVASSLSSADVAAQAPYMLSLNSQVQSSIAASGFGSFINTASVMSNPTTFQYNAGYSLDGLHAGQAGAFVLAQYVSNFVLSLFGTPPQLNGITPLIGPSAARNSLKLPSNSYKNIFQNPTFAQATSGLATGITTSLTVEGTSTVVESINTVNGITYQDFAITPATFDANGNAAISINIIVPVQGTTPIVPMQAGDCIQASFDVVIDNGSGGAATNVCGFGSRLLLSNAATNIYGQFPQYDATTNHEQLTAVMSGRLTTQPVQSPDISANLSLGGQNLNFYISAITTTPYRVRITNIVMVKIPKDPTDNASTVGIDTVATATNANYTLTGPQSVVILPVITAARNFIIPVASSYPGRVIKVWNKNTSSSFSWSFNTGTVVDAGANSITTLVNDLWYTLESDGTNWNIISQTGVSTVIARGQVALVGGTKAISITGVTTSSRAIIELVTPSGGSLTIQFQAVCTAGTLTIQANVAAGTINTSDVSTVNYIITN
jgi:hypothetical protein